MSAVTTADPRQRNKDLVRAFYAQVIAARDADAVRRFVADDYRQHGPDMPDGAAAMESYARRTFETESTRDPDTEIEPVFTIAEDDLVTICFYMPQPEIDGSGVYDYFAFNTYRVKDEKLAERWSNVHKYARPRHGVASVATGSGSGESVSSDSSDVVTNKQLVTSFYQQVFGKMNPDAVREFVAEDYHQHSSHMPQGREGLERLVRGIAASVPPGTPPAELPAPDVIMAEGDIVVAAACLPQPDPDDPTSRWPYFAYDAYRIRDWKLAEHWSGMNKAAPPQHG
jgi:predicted SnoaL-like aldol condensation-catalyzing enzyme